MIIIENLLKIFFVLKQTNDQSVLKTQTNIESLQLKPLKPEFSPLHNELDTKKYFFIFGIQNVNEITNQHSDTVTS